MEREELAPHTAKRITIIGKYLDPRITDTTSLMNSGDDLDGLVFEIKKPGHACFLAHVKE